MRRHRGPGLELAVRVCEEALGIRAGVEVGVCEEGLGILAVVESRSVRRVWESELELEAGIPEDGLGPGLG